MYPILPTGWTREDCPDEKELSSLGEKMHDAAIAVSYDVQGEPQPLYDVYKGLIYHYHSKAICIS